METMKAAVLVKPGHFEVRAVPAPVCGPRDVVIDVDRAGICGSDIHMFNGHYAADRLPIIPGHEFTGRIRETGSAVTGLKAGQRVVADINIGCGTCYYCRRGEVLNCAEVRQAGISRDGAFAERIALPAHLVIPAPEDADPDVLALTEPIACVVRAARKSGVGFARSVVILGAGPIGNLHVQMMRLVGAAPIIVVEIDPQRAEFARKAGADIVVTDPAKALETVRAATDGRGADFVIESVGMQKLYALAFELIRPGGHVAAFGLTGPDDSVPLKPLETVLRENSVKGSVAGIGEDMHDALALLVHGRFDVSAFTGRHFDLDDVQQAFETLPQRKGDLKTLIRI
jgi:2-desacetyl-2-hydroxyethyl bacteriochlorophyllide A dehydrogenase